MLCVIVLLAVALFFFNRAARKKNKQLEEERMSSFKVGDKVMTSSGIYGTIVDIKEISPVDKLVNIRTGTVQRSYVRYTRHLPYVCFKQRRNRGRKYRRQRNTGRKQRSNV